MTIEISSEDEKLLGELVAHGGFQSPEHALHAFLEALTTSIFSPEVDEDWGQYADERIRKGLEDAEAGHTISAEQFLAELNARRSKVA